MDRRGFLTRCESGTSGRKIVEITFEQISSVTPTDKSVLRGPSFGHGGHDWFLEIKALTTPESQTWISLFLVLENGGNMDQGLEILAKFAYTIVDPLDPKNNITKPQNLEQEGFVVYNNLNHSWGYSKFVTLGELSRPDRGYLHKDRLIVRIEVVSLVTAIELHFEGGFPAHLISRKIFFAGFEWAVVARCDDDYLGLFLKMMELKDDEKGGHNNTTSTVQPAVRTLFRITARKSDDRLLFDTKMMPNACIFTPGLMWGWKDFKSLQGMENPSKLKLAVRTEILACFRVFGITFGVSEIGSSMTLSNQFRYRNVEWSIGQSEQEGHLGIFLCCNSSFFTNLQMKCKAKYKLIVANQKNPRNSVEEMYEMEFSSNCFCWGKPKFISMETLKAPDGGFIVDDKFTINVEFISAEIIRTFDEKSMDTEPVAFREAYENAKKRKLEELNGTHRGVSDSAKNSKHARLLKNLYIDTLRSALQNAEPKPESLPKVKFSASNLLNSTYTPPRSGLQKEVLELFASLKEIVDKMGPVHVAQLGAEYKKRTGRTINDDIQKVFPTNLATMVALYKEFFSFNNMEQITGIFVDPVSIFGEQWAQNKINKIQLEDTAALAISAAAEELVDFLKKNLPLEIDRVVQPRTAQKPSVLIPGEDIEIVVFLDDLPLRGHHLWKQPLILLFEEILKDLPNCTKLSTTESSVKLIFKEIPFELFPCANFSSKKELREEMKSRPSVWFTVAACEDRLDFLNSQPAEVKDAIKLLKAWRAYVEWYAEDQRPPSYLLELVAIKAGQGGKKSNVEVFKRALQLLQYFGSIQAKWSDFYTDDAVPPDVLAQVPLVLDPTNPANNLAANFDWSLLQREAQTEPLSASLQQLINS